MQHTNQTARSGIHPFFFGRDGLRAGWSLLIALVLILALFPLTNTLLRLSHLVPPHAAHTAPGPMATFLVEIAALLVTVIVTRVMAEIEHRSVSLYGFGGEASGIGRGVKYLMEGMLCGVVAISVLVLVLWKAGLLIFDQRLLFGTEALKYALVWIPGFLAIGFFEEYMFRGYLQYTLARGLAGLTRYLSPKLDAKAAGFWAAAVAVSFGFGAIHGSNPGESPFGLVCAGLASLLFCFSLWRTGSLWWAIGMHAAWDYGQSFLFGVADSGSIISYRLMETHPAGAPLLSGGTTGPEGSILCLPVLAAVALVIHLTQPARQKGYAALMPEITAEDTEGA